MKYKPYNPKDSSGKEINSRSQRKKERKAIFSHNQSLHYRTNKKKESSND